MTSAKRGKRRWPFPVRSVKARMILSFSLLLIAALGVVQTSSFYLSNQEIEHNLMVAVKNSLRVGLDHIDAQFADAENFAVGLMSAEEVQTALTEPVALDSFDYDIMLRRLDDLVRRSTTSRLAIKKVYFINEKGQIPDSLLNVIPSAAATALADGYPEGSIPILSGIHREIYDGSRVEVISVIRRVFRATQSTRPIGVVVVEVDAAIVQGSLDSFELPAEGHMLLLSADGNLVYESVDSPGAPVDAGDIAERIAQEDADSVITVDGVRYVCSSEVSAVTGWRLVSVIPQKQLFQAATRGRNFTLLLMLVCIVVAIAVSLVIVNQVSKPISLLLGSMKEVEAGRLDSSVRYSGVEEMRKLVDGYNSMTAKMGSLIAAVKREEEEKRRAELYALQAQISPHFLYNTLNSIRYLAWEHDVPDIARITASLINLSRASLDFDRFVTIGQEMQLVEDYMEIAAVRYGDIVRYEASVEPGLADCLIPRFSIQPLVENALFHGILPAESGGITVEMATDGEDILIRVADTGAGIEPERMGRIRSALAGGPEETSIARGDDRRLKSIGLANINSRIRLYFSDRYGLTIDSAAGAGVCVQIRIPAKREI